MSVEAGLVKDTAVQDIHTRMRIDGVTVANGCREIADHPQRAELRWSLASLLVGLAALFDAQRGQDRGPGAHGLVSMSVLDLVAIVESPVVQEPPQAPPVVHNRGWACPPPPAPRESRERRRAKQSVSRALRQRVPDLEACNRTVVERDPAFTTKMTFTLTFDRSGKVQTVTIEEKGDHDQAFQRCVRRRIGTWRFRRTHTRELPEFVFAVSFTS